MKKRFLSLIIALAMMVGVFTPLLSSAEGEHKTKVNIHKVVMNKTDWENVKEKEHNGKEIPVDDFKTYFADSAKLAAGVQFDIYREAKEKEPEGTKKVKGNAIASSVFEAEKEYVLVNSVKTEGNPAKATVTLFDGTYYVAENKEKSTYVGEKGEKLTGMKAVPFKLVLPAAMPDGKKNYDEKDALNVYPKNTEDKVVATKDFAKESTETTTKLGEEGVKTKKLNNKDKDPAYAKYKEKKDLVNQTVGKTVPYIVKTKIPQNSVLTNLNWSDLMDKGLTYNEKSLNVKIGTDKEIIKNGELQEAYKGWFTLKETVSGFTLEATEKGLKEIAKLAKDGDVEFKLNYYATVNEDAVVDKPMDNHITVDYGNKPDGGFDVEKGKTEVSIEKTWAEGQAPANAKVKYFLIEKDTGKVVDQVTKEGTDLSHKFTGLNKDKEYKIVEVFDGYRPTYEKTENGVKITNTETPTTIVPTPPQVETYGKKFVKTNNETGENAERLQGAQFIVKTPFDNKYLGLKDAETQKANKEAYDKAQEEYIEAVEKKADDIETKKKTRDEAFAKLKMQWDYVDKANAFVFTSNENGQFEVMGLEQGKYTLVETKAPAGYAVPSNPEKEFEVGPLTASSREVNIKYNKDTDKTNNAQQITNTKVTIPQTGGIGTIIFTAIGLAIMASAIIAIKKRQATEAR